MTWWDYVKRCTAAPKAHIAQAIGITPSSVGRWEKGSSADPLQAAAFARAYGRPVLEAFVAAGFLTASEAGEAPAAAPSLDALDDDELLAEVRRRMTGGTSDERQSEDEKIPLTTRADVTTAARTVEESPGKRMADEASVRGEESQDDGSGSWDTGA